MSFEDRILEEKLTQLIRRTVCELPEESLNALKAAHDREDEGSIAKAHLETNLKIALPPNMNSMCADTGFPVFFVRIGTIRDLDLAQIQRCAKAAVERLQPMVI